MTSIWFFLSTLNYDARSTTHQKFKLFVGGTKFVCKRSVQWITYLISNTVITAVFVGVTRILIEWRESTVGIRSQVMNRGKIGLDQSLMYIHPFPLVVTPVFWPLFNTMYRKIILT